MVWLKICGLKRRDNARKLAELPLDALGINRYEESSRYVERSTAAELAEEVRSVNPNIDVVGVYVNESLEHIREDHGRINWDVVQLHGEERPEFVSDVSELLPVIKAFQVGEDFSPEELVGFDCWGYLMDAYHPEKYGGTGETAPWERIQFLTDDYRIILAGGLTPWNAVEAVRAVDPWGIDLCSGVETDDGTKDVVKVEGLIETLKQEDLLN